MKFNVPSLWQLYLQYAKDPQQQFENITMDFGFGSVEIENRPI